MELSVSTELCGVKLRNPTVLASGILGVGADLLVRVAEAGAGAVTSKSATLKPRAGHPNPSVLDWGMGLINAVGLSNPGVEEEVREIREAVKRSKSPVIASIAASSVEDFALAAERISAAEPALIEANISCPNVEDEFGAPFASSASAAAEVTAAIKKATHVPLLVKLSPNVSDIKVIAKAVEKAGADGITAVNTVGPGMVIDVDVGKPILANKRGGLSGPAIKPIAVRCVYDVCSTVKIPVVGTGGVSTGRDAVEMIMAGAAAVGIGSAVHYRGLSVFALVEKEIKNFMSTHNYSCLEDFRGKALQDKERS
ncbi:MAG: dihydroorotate dehydrogenase [Candidatus Micrarchaeia archaeon]|jgi:dihydroorotate dehydrogenase (NAD+) catalytic subunit